MLYNSKLKMNCILNYVKLIFLFLLFTFTSCDLYFCSYETGAKEYKEFVETPSNNLDEMYQQFSRYSVEQQIDIYLYARNCPDNPQIQKFLVKDGENKIPAIVERIKKERIRDKYFLMTILLDINRNCGCIKKDSEIIKTLESIKQEIGADKDISSNDIYTQGYSDSLKTLKEQIDKQNSVSETK